MVEYLVTWKIDIDARTPTAAAKEALKIMQEVGSEATFFEVKSSKAEYEVDLLYRTIKKIVNGVD